MFWFVFFQITEIMLTLVILFFFLFLSPYTVLVTNSSLLGVTFVASRKTWPMIDESRLGDGAKTDWRILLAKSLAGTRTHPL